MADLLADRNHARLTRWTLGRLNVEMETWAVQREFEELSSEYHKMTGGNNVAATFDFHDFIGHDFFTSLDAEWEEDLNG